MFTETSAYLGTIKARKEIEITFPYTDVYMIVSMKASCGCSVPHDIRTQNKVVVKYSPKPVPEHLKAEGKGYYTSTKTVEVLFVDTNKVARQQTLTITATITD